MAKNFINFDKLEELSKKERVNLDEKIIKLFEEGGELAQAILAYKGCPTASASGNADDILQECCDVMNVVLDIVNFMEFTSEEAEAMFNKKLNKWESKQNALSSN